MCAASPPRAAGAAGPFPARPAAQTLASVPKTFPQPGGCRALWGLFLEDSDDQCDPLHRPFPDLFTFRREHLAGLSALSPPCATARDLSRRPPGSASGTAAPKGKRYPDVTKPAPPILVARHPPRRLYLLRLTPKHRYWAGRPPAALGSRLSGARAGAHALCGGLPPRERAEMSGAARAGDQPRGALAPRIQVGSPGTRAPGPECPWRGAPLPRAPASPLAPSALCNPRPLRREGWPARTEPHIRRR